MAKRTEVSTELCGKLFQMNGAAWLRAQLRKAVQTLWTCRRLLLFDLSVIYFAWNINLAKYASLIIVTVLNTHRSNLSNLEPDTILNLLPVQVS